MKCCNKALADSAPAVVVAETDEGHRLVVAATFDQFITELLHYEAVYDRDGHVILPGK